MKVYEGKFRIIINDSENIRDVLSDIKKHHFIEFEEVERK